MLINYEKKTKLKISHECYLLISHFSVMPFPLFSKLQLPLEQNEYINHYHKCILPFCQYERQHDMYGVCESALEKVNVVVKSH